MSRAIAIAARLFLSLLGGVALYVLLYGGTGWLANAIGYDNSAGRAIGFMNGALSWLGWGPILFVLLCVGLFLLLSKLGVLKGPSDTA
jgi:hypothetical protein